MSVEENKIMRELVKSAAAIFANMNTEETLSYKFGRSEIPTLRVSERIRVVFIREHDEPLTVTISPVQQAEIVEVG